MTESSLGNKSSREGKIKKGAMLERMWGELEVIEMERVEENGEWEENKGWRERNSNRKVT